MWDKDIVQRAAGQICQYKCTKLPINASSSGRSIALRASQKRRAPASRKGMLAKTVKSLLIIGLSIYKYPN